MAETKLSTHTNEALFLRDKNLVEDVMGKMSFTDAMFYHIMGIAPSTGQRAILDAVLVTLMEHGFTPSAIAARMTYLSAPEAMQSAVAAGLLSVASQFIGTMENAAKNIYPWLPVKYLLKDKYDSESKIKKIKIPILIIHGKKDRIVPFKMGKKLYELANNPKFFYSTQEDDHMMQFNEQLMKSIKNFLDFNT